MKEMTKINRPTVRALALALTVATLPALVARAVPYASGITNNGTTVSYYLNEAATNVTVIYDGGGAGNTNNLGTLSRGVHTFPYAGHSSYKIVVTQTAPVGWTQISSDTNPGAMYGSPRGVVVSQVATNLSTFGRIYVSDSASPATTALRLQDAVTKQWRTNDSKGIFVLNADLSDAVGQMTVCGTNVCYHAFTNGMQLNLTTPSTSSPFRLGFGQDNRLYGSSFGTIDATTWRSLDADAKNFELVLDVPGENNNPTVHTDSATKVIAHGSTDSGTLQVWNLDGAYSGHLNGIAQWDIGAGPLPWNNPPTFVGTAQAHAAADVTCDLDLGADGKWFLLVNRSAGTDSPSIKIYDTDGTTLLWDSFTAYGIVAGNTANPDPLRNAQACALSPDGKTFSFVRTDNSIMMFSLTNGIIDQSTLYTYTAPASGSVSAPATGNGRQISYDAAGNLYTVSSGQARLRVYAPGGFTVATTSSDGTFTVQKPATTVSVTATTPTTSMDTTQPPGVFTLTRAGDTASPLAVGYTLTGTATNGVHYTLLSGTVNFLGGDVTKNVNVVAIPVTPAGPTRSVILTLNTSNTYSPAAPLTATVFISDTNKPVLSISRRDAQMYERTNDLARFTISRLGNTNVDLSNVIITYGGTATNGADYIGTTPVDIQPGIASQVFSISPIHNGVVTGPLTVTATIAPAVDNSYTVGATNTSAAVTIVDSDDPPETVLWADYFTNDTHLDWTVLYATTNGAPDNNYRVNDYTGDWTQGWPYDYVGYLGIPLAPHAVNGSSGGIRLTVNKDQPTENSVASALNLYPTGKSFSGNYALRFDMFLIQNDKTSTTEYALFGINHSGTKTNWFRNSTTGYAGVDPTTWSFDGIFYDVEADGSANGDYVGYSAPTKANRNPTPITPGVNASTLTGVFKSPPWTPGAGSGGAAANKYGTATPIWADVEVKQVNGVISWSINHTLIFAYTNTTPYTSGNVMLGYTDAYDSLGTDGGSVVYANVRVISLQNPNIVKIERVGANAEVTFSANAGDTTGQFVLQSASVVNGPYADTTSTISLTSPGVFKAVKAAGPTQQYYRVRRVY
jgi:hypothetical protein